MLGCRRRRGRSGPADQLEAGLVHGGAHGLVVEGASETTVTTPVEATACTEPTPAISQISPETAPSQCPQLIPLTL